MYCKGTCECIVRAHVNVLYVRPHVTGKISTTITATIVLGLVLALAQVPELLVLLVLRVPLVLLVIVILLLHILA